MSIPAGELNSGIVSVQDLIDYMSGISLTEQQRRAAAATLYGVQQELELYLNRPIQPVQVRETLTPDHSGVLNVSVSPVRKVIAITPITTDPLTPPEITPYVPPAMDRDEDFPPDGRLEDWAYKSYNYHGVIPGGIVLYPGGYGYYPTFWHPFFLVEYIGGYDGYVDESLKLAIMRVAAREMERNHDDTLSLRGDQATTAAESDNRDKGWTEEEKRQFDRLRRRTVV